MADALCGPSNPLQSFRKQTQLDRTLQQDRIVGPRNSASQGFRTHDPRTGSYDADLHAFEHSTPSPASFQFQQPPPSQGFAPSAGAPAWAADFQKLQISSPSTPVSFVQQHQQQQQHLGWGSEFMMHNQKLGTPSSDIKGKQVMQEPPLQGSIYNTAAYGATSYQSQMLPVQSMQPQQPYYSQQETHQDFQFSDTDFEAAFQDALHQAEQQLDQTQPEPHEVYNSNGIEVEQPHQQLPIGSDAINYIEQADRTANQDSKDADELARTAGQLLNLVQHDTSDKMRNSQFLDLMRKIRDREVEVQNSDLHSIANPVSQTTTGGEDVSMDSSPDSNFYHEIPQFANHPDYTPNPLADTSTESATGNSRTHDPDTDSFAFPNMDAVYDYAGEGERYSSHDDEYPTQHPGPPQSQIQALHPGGRFYPEQTSPKPADAQMSGAVGPNGTGLMNVGTGSAQFGGFPISFPRGSFAQLQQQDQQA